MSVRSASRGSPAAKSIRLALRTSSIVATRRASFVRWVLRCFGRRRLSSSPKLPAISLMPSMMRFQVPPRADSLNHKPIRHVNNLLLILIDGKEFDPWHEAKPGMPFVAHPVPKERDSLGRIGNAGLLDGQLQPHRLVQVRGECRLFFLGLLAGSCDENDEVVGIPDRKEHRPPGFAVAHARAHRRRHWITATVRPYLSTVVCPPLIPFLDNAEGDIGKQRRNHSPNAKDNLGT